MPCLGRLADSRLSTTSLTEYRVSPSNRGLGSLIASQPSANPFSLVSVTPSPATMAMVIALFTSGRLNSVNDA